MKLTRRQLKRLISESFSIRKTLFVFDFDDTLAHTDSMVRLERDNEITDLDSGAFAAYAFQPGDQLDFTDFNRVSGKLIANTLAILNNAQRSGQDIVIITARPPGAVPGIQQFFADNNMESPPIYATSGSANKLPVMRNLLVQGDYDHVIVYEDCMKNIEKLGDVVRDMGVSYSAICIDHNTTMRKIYEGNMKITRRHLRRLIESVFIGSPDGTLYSPDDVRAARERGRAKDAQALGKDPRLDPLFQSDDIANRRMGRELAITLGHQPELSDIETLAVDDLDSRLVDASMDDYREQSKDVSDRKIHHDIIQQFRKYLLSDAAQNRVKTLAADAVKYPQHYRLSSPKISWIYSFINAISGFNLDARLEPHVGRDEGGYIKRWHKKELAPILKQMAEEKFPDEYIDILRREMKGEKFPLTIIESQIRKLIREAFIAGDDVSDPDNVQAADIAYGNVTHKAPKSIDKYRASVGKPPIGDQIMSDDPAQAIELGMAVNPDMFTDHENIAAQLPADDRKAEDPLDKKTARNQPRYLDGRPADSYTMTVDLEDGMVVEIPFVEYEDWLEAAINPKTPDAYRLDTLMYYYQEIKDAEKLDDSTAKNYALSDLRFEYGRIKEGALAYIRNNYNTHLTLSDNFISIKLNPTFKRGEAALMMGEELLRKFNSTPSSHRRRIN